MDSKVFAQRKSVFWRIHLWAAFIATPFAFIGALTGMLYIFTPQIEAVLHGDLDRVTPAATRLSLDALVALAQRAAPEGTSLRYVVTPDRADQSVRVYFGAATKTVATTVATKTETSAAKDGEHAEHQATGVKEAAVVASTPALKMDHRIPQGSIVYLNPYTGDVLGTQGEMDRFSTWSKRLHSSLLQGNDWRWLLELSTSWLLVMLLTGIYLWWPRGGQGIWPHQGLKARVGWQQWHAFGGVALSIITLIVLTTGLTWSRYSGAQIKALADAVGQSTPETPKGLRSQSPPNPQPLLQWQQVWDAAQPQAPSISYQITPPKQASDVWRITNFDRSQPTKRFTLLMDSYSGQGLYYQSWESLTLFNKATAVGIPFHRGEFGWWNQALLLVFGLGIMWGLISGWVMFFKRKRQGVLGLPRLMPEAWRSVPLPAWLIGLALLPAMPVWAWSAGAICLIEVWLTWRSSRTWALLAR
ncbi:MAG: hypothetical protein RLZZ612_1597 [Pseudomonadota bacterium]|jgi:uncharacterized iron-regulated membrane protein